MRDGSQGFALVQLLASLVILGLMSLLLTQGLTTGRRVWERLDTRANGNQSIAAAQDELRARVERTYPRTDYQSAPPYVDFTGDETHLEFLSPPSDANRPSALRSYALAVSAGGDLVLSSTSDLAAETGAAIDKERLLAGVEQVDIAYFGAIKSDPVLRWRSRWKQEPGLPRLVRVSVTFPAGDPRQWPDLIIAPAATTDSDCVLDPALHHCQGR